MFPAQFSCFVRAWIFAHASKTPQFQNRPGHVLFLSADATQIQQKLDYFFRTAALPTTKQRDWEYCHLARDEFDFKYDAEWVEMKQLEQLDASKSAEFQHQAKAVAAFLKKRKVNEEDYLTAPVVLHIPRQWKKWLRGTDPVVSYVFYPELFTWTKEFVDDFLPKELFEKNNESDIKEENSLVMSWGTKGVAVLREMLQRQESVAFLGTFGFAAFPVIIDLFVQKLLVTQAKLPPPKTDEEKQFYQQFLWRVVGVLQAVFTSTLQTMAIGPTQGSIRVEFNVPGKQTWLDVVLPLIKATKSSGLGVYSTSLVNAMSTYPLNVCYHKFVSLLTETFWCLRALDPQVCHNFGCPKASHPLWTCPCSKAFYCSKQCRQDDAQDVHKLVCTPK